jgi:hypothetical protein
MPTFKICTLLISRESLFLVFGRKSSRVLDNQSVVAKCYKSRQTQTERLRRWLDRRQLCVNDSEPCRYTLPQSFTNGTDFDISCKGGKCW